MSVGLGLLRKLVLERRSISYLNEQGVKEEAFPNESELKVYHFITAHFRKYGQAPKLTTIEKTTKVIFGKMPSEPIEYWISHSFRWLLPSICVRESQSDSLYN